MSTLKNVSIPHVIVGARMERAPERRQKLRVRRGPLFAACVLLISACGSGEIGAGLTDGITENDGGAGQHENSAALLTPTCAWLLAVDPNLINIAFPDEDARYWLAVVPAIPGAQYEIKGRYPAARYFSFNSYDLATRPTDVITDFQIAPRVGSRNPFVEPEAPPGGDYRIAFRVEPRPEQEEPNTLYAGGIALPGGVSLPTPVIPILYRIYVPEGDLTGGAGLPEILIQAPGVDENIIGFSGCELLRSPQLSVVNDLLREASSPVPSPGVDLLPLTEAAPRFRKFFGVPNFFTTLVEIALPFDLPVSEFVEPDGGSLLSNIDNAYVFAQYTRDKGDLYIVRARAPTHPGISKFREEELRYWSICTNATITQRVVACLRDELVPLDDEGFFTVIVSDPANRPQNAINENDIAWLPWGGAFFESILIYRHMLPNEGFQQAIQRVEFGQDEADVMGDYYPRTSYCSRRVIEAAGSLPTDIFRACEESARAALVPRA